MSLPLNDKSEAAIISRHLTQAQAEHADALEKLSSGQIFTRNDPRPSEKALAEGLEFRLRSLSSAKNHIHSAVSLLQTAESALDEMGDMILRMQEITAATTAISNRDRRYLLVEYEALHDEINRIAATTALDGLPLLSGFDERKPDELVVRMGDPSLDQTLGLEAGDALKSVHFKDLRHVVATTTGRGLKRAQELLAQNPDEGLDLADVADPMPPASDAENLKAYEEAQGKIADVRAELGAHQSRLHRALDFVDVFQENMAAAKSSIAEVDYAQEVCRLVKSRMLAQAGTTMLAHGNIATQLALNLLKAIG